MTYRLIFSDKTRREWNKLGATIRDQFRKVLLRRLEEPRVPSARVHGAGEFYKIKLRNAGYRLIYEVLEKEIVVLVVAIGRRDGDEVYDDFRRELKLRQQSGSSD